MFARSIRLGSAALLVLAGCTSSGGSSSHPSETARSTDARRDVVIQLSDMDVRPPVARVQRGGSVAWTSIASNYFGVVSFPATIVSRFTCKELRPDFVVDGDRLVSSRPLRGDDEDLVLPCPLEPGTYPYRIELSESGEGGGMVERELDPVRSLPASLVVE